MAARAAPSKKPHPPERRRAGKDSDQQKAPVVVRLNFVTGFAGLASVVALTALAALTGHETTAAVGVTAVGAIVTAVVAAGVSYLRNKKR
jgi:hypothetical protein